MKKSIGVIMFLSLLTSTKNFYPATQVTDKNNEYLFSSESVTEGHPDKLCDQISDAILDAYLEKDKNSRVACETMAAKNIIVVAGEITSDAEIDIAQVVKDTIKKIGYVKSEYGLNISNYKLITSINKQSENISRGVDISEEKEQGAGDQGLMFGYACNQTKEFMPLPIMFAHKLTKKLAEVRKEKILSWVRPDGKAQVTFKYVNNEPKEITTIVLSTQHDPEISYKQIEKEITKHVILPICKKYITENTKFFINPTGKFEIGGPQADCGLTGRKIIVDTYGGIARHGGGCFSGKDPSKVDRSAAYMARHIAKNIVAASLAKECEVQIAYSIGIAEPVSLYINTFGTSSIDELKITNAVKKVFPLKPYEIIDYLDLKRPIYLKTASYGHFGKTEDEFSWEKINKVDELKKELNIAPKIKTDNKLISQKSE